DGLLTSAAATVSLTVSQVVLPPVAANYQYTMLHDRTLSVTAPANGVLANDTDPQGLALTAVLDQGPAHGALTLNTNGTFTFTPSAGFVGNDSFTYKANDGFVSSADGTVKIAVTDTAPITQADSYVTKGSFPLNISASRGVLANDTDPDLGDTLTALPGSVAPKHGTIALHADGSFIYTPTPGFVGTDGFTYKAFDGALASADTQVTIHVLAGPAPVVTTSSVGSPIAAALVSSNPSATAASVPSAVPPQPSALSLPSFAQVTSVPPMTAAIVMGSSAPVLSAPMLATSDLGSLSTTQQAELITGPSPIFTRLAQLIQRSPIIVDQDDAPQTPSDVWIFDSVSGDFDRVHGRTGDALVDGNEQNPDWLIMNEATAFASDEAAALPGAIVWQSGLTL
ncbi:MAG TPA: Ig-like domain-containing protein, partial [Stellaceae bacterium]|nr:Ig-like domain-containing protein [Stellaceae bacterium]